ncbi:LacI family DNA-binding transcriptional regulator [Pelagicoccus sp. NFK12]|uniref:LacI family DNA-binding transcriptional regulator n=1 Tax=Pelagicoccus enzymogenes TaxID=2773457 RepID=A0A927F567_9BACT|nr:LacI family DNA-binding transcriptional regulator [Pelagicoccus enzymogenes]MBD5778583.1 LacI family DNA-binding transcriptional regulator [Pelagicoccus enzymogenes]
MEKTNRRIVTLADVAQLAGVNKSTVSRALRDCSHVGHATRAKVLKAAEALGYRPDPTISRLAAQRWRSGGGRSREVLTLLLWRRTKRVLRLVALSRQLCEKYGYDADIVYASDFVSAESLRRSLEFRGAEKILSLGLLEGDRLDPLLLKRFQIVNCCSILEQSVCSVDLDWRRMLGLGVDHFQRRGIRKIGLVLTASENRESRILKDRFEELFSFKYQVLPVFSGNLGTDDNVLLSWYDEYEPESIVSDSYSVFQTLEGRVADRSSFLTLKSDDESQCDEIVGFCCGDRLVIERAIQLLRLEKLPGSESRMELHHIVPDWRAPVEAGDRHCGSCS